MSDCYIKLQHPNLRLQLVVFGLERYSTNLIIQYLRIYPGELKTMLSLIAYTQTFNNESMVSLVSRRYMRVVNGSLLVWDVRRTTGSERPQTLHGLLKISKITNHGRPLSSLATRLVT